MNKKICFKCRRPLKVSDSRAHRIWTGDEGKLCGGCYSRATKRVGFFRVRGTPIICKKCGWSQLTTRAKTGQTTCGRCKFRIIFDNDAHNKYHNPINRKSYRRMKVERVKKGRVKR